MSTNVKFKRFVAIVIDCVIAGILGFAPFIGFVLPFVYILLKDGMGIEGLKRRSIGKLAMGIRVVDLDGSTDKQTPLDSLKRNILMVVPFMGIVESIVVLIDPKAQRLGDKIAQTLVVEG